MEACTPYTSTTDRGTPCTGNKVSTAVPGPVGFKDLADSHGVVVVGRGVRGETTTGQRRETSTDVSADSLVLTLKGSLCQLPSVRRVLRESVITWLEMRSVVSC